MLDLAPMPDDLANRYARIVRNLAEARMFVEQYSAPMKLSPASQAKWLAWWQESVAFWEDQEAQLNNC